MLADSSHNWSVSVGVQHTHINEGSSTVDEMTSQQRATMQEETGETPVGDDEIDLSDLVQEMDRSEQELGASSMIGGSDFEMLEFDEHDLFGTFIDASWTRKTESCQERHSRLGRD
jgi:hypothetical protein